jgi:hypothetical protein
MGFMGCLLYLQSERFKMQIEQSKHLRFSAGGLGSVARACDKKLNNGLIVEFLDK